MPNDGGHSILTSKLKKLAPNQLMQSYIIKQSLRKSTTCYKLDFRSINVHENCTSMHLPKFSKKLIVLPL